MWHIAALTILGLSLYFFAHRAVRRSIVKRERTIGELELRLADLRAQNERLGTQNAGLERAAEQTIALYDLTRDICKTMDEGEIFRLFKERLGKLIVVDDCLFLKDLPVPDEFSGYFMLPLAVHRGDAGNLLVRGLREQDKEIFLILAQQFLLGLKRSSLYRQVQELIVTDSLTQAMSRRYFLERCAHELERSVKFKLRVSFLMIDIDRFKSFNDQYGHLVGDAVLKSVAGIIKDSVRQADFIGRYGGEELGVILAETDKEQGGYAAERIRKAVESSRLAAYDENLQATVSVGLATFPDDAQQLPELIDKADRAMYQAKKQGRNRVCAA